MPKADVAFCASTLHNLLLTAIYKKAHRPNGDSLNTIENAKFSNA